MKEYPTLTEFAEMARQLNQVKPEELERRAKRWHAAEPLWREIDAAFDGVTLGKGVGLMEAQGLDDYADADMLAVYRAKDEKDDWRRIPAEALNLCHSSLSFFDGEGMRFHLPAYLIAELRGEYGFDLDFHLAYFRDHLITQFELLNDTQRQAVRDYLLFLVAESDRESDVAHIRHALESFWPDMGLR